MKLFNKDVRAIHAFLEKGYIKCGFEKNYGYRSQKLIIDSKLPIKLFNQGKQNYRMNT